MSLKNHSLEKEENSVRKRQSSAINLYFTISAIQVPTSLRIDNPIRNKYQKNEENFHEMKIGKFLF